MNLEDIPEEELQWTKLPVIGWTLMGAKTDSDGNPIERERFYKVAKHLPTGKLIIVATDDTQMSQLMNIDLKKQGRLN